MNQEPECLRFVGLSLSGSKSSKTSMAIFEYYKPHDKVVLSHIFDKISVLDDRPSDHMILETLSSLQGLQSIFVNAPLQLPKCMTCKLKCPGYEKCKEPEIQWMTKHYIHLSQQKKPHKLISPYTERCSELYWRNQLDEEFILDHAGGANKAPLMFRAMFLRRLFKTHPEKSKTLKKVIWNEFYPSVSAWQWGRSLKISKSNLRHFSHSVHGNEVREIFMDQISKKTDLFLYEVERKKLINDKNAFEAFLGALTAFSFYNNEHHKKPKNYPKNEPWPIIPV